MDKLLNFLMKKPALLICALVLLVSACNTGTDDQTPALKDAYEGAFLIGTAPNNNQIYGRDKRGRDLIKKHFNSITPENVTKWEYIQPEPGIYDFEAADKFVEFGEENDMFMVGHTLVWHAQTPSWVFEDDEGNPVNRDILLERMRDHIHTVVGRYKGRIHGWDVVNEAIDEDGSMRKSPWYNIIGEDYVIEAFRFAREADPDAELYYNDYNLEHAEKREGAIRLIRSLLDKGAPITGVGTQGHYDLIWPEQWELEETIEDFAALGLDVMITELDIDVLPSAFDYTGAEISMRFVYADSLNPYPEGLPDDVEQQLAERYRELFEVFLKHKDSITRVTLWGVTDGDSWKNNWPVRGRTNYPLLFDRKYRPKPAFFEVVELPDKLPN